MRRSRLRIPTRVAFLPAFLVAFLVAFLAASLAASTAHADAPRVGPLFDVHPGADARRAVNQLMARVVAEVAQGRTPIVMFDLDDTLLDTTPADPALRQAAGASHLASVRPFRGATTLVRRLAAAGATIAYVTARPEKFRGVTEASLRGHRLPVGGRHRVLLRHDKMSVPASKTTHLAELARGGVVVAAFDNEAGNTRAFQDALPGAMIFHHATRSKRADPHPERGRDGVIVLGRLPIPPRPPGVRPGAPSRAPRTLGRPGGARTPAPVNHARTR